MKKLKPHTSGLIERALNSDHEELEVLFQRVITSLGGGDPESIRARWLELDRALEQHLCMEETLILPGFTQENPAAAARIRREHREIRAHMVQLGVDLDLHELSPGSAARFIESLRQHAKYEEVMFYPWSQLRLGQDEKVSLLKGLLDAGARQRHQREQELS